MRMKGVLELIGDTPLVEVRNLPTGCCRLFLKLENQNPGGSIKDRIALSMVEAAEREGRLQPGGHLVEATAGNTGLGLALVAAQKGYALTLVIPDKMSREKIAHLRALGANIVLTRSDVEKGHPEYYQDLAERLAREIPGAIYVDQFNNPANPLAHELGTGPEIRRDLPEGVDAVVCGVGSGGTLTGLSRFFAQWSPATEMVLADPEGSVLKEFVASGKPGKAGSWLVEGIGEDFIPGICDLSRVRKAYTISDEESFRVARELLRQEGILAGSSSGTLVAAALRYCQEQTTPRTVVSLVVDSGNKYLSKMFSDDWMMAQGLLKPPSCGDLRDAVVRRWREGRVVSVGPEDTLQTAWKRMSMYDFSQLPVMVGSKPVGLIGEREVASALASRPVAFQERVGEHMDRELAVLGFSASLQDALALLRQGRVPLVMAGEELFGILTTADVINHIRNANKG